MAKRTLLVASFAAIAIALLAAWLITLNVQPGDLGAALASVNPGALALASGLGLVEVTLRALRFRRALQYLGHTVAIPRAWLAQVVGLFAGGVTPFRLGEVGKALFLRQDRVPIPAGVAGSILERILDLLGLAILMLLAALGLALAAPYLVLASLIAGILIVLATLAFLLPGLLTTILARLPRFPSSARKRLLEWVTPPAESIRGRRLFFVTELSLWTTPIIAANIAVVTVLLAGIGLSVDLRWIGLAISLGTLAGVASLLPGGIAVTETSYTILLVQGGVPPVDALAVTLLARFLTFYPYMALGWALGMREVLWRPAPRS